MHSFKDITTKQKDKTIYSIFVERFMNDIYKQQQGIDKLKELQAPDFVIQLEQDKLTKMQNKVKNSTYKPTLTYKDNLDKSILELKIKTCVEEYNSNNKLVALLINDEIKINFATRYCPIVTKI